VTIAVAQVPMSNGARNINLWVYMSLQIFPLRSENAVQILECIDAYGNFFIITNAIVWNWLFHEFVVVVDSPLNLPISCSLYTLLEISLPVIWV
jgi:hypothetical protein